MKRRIFFGMGLIALISVILSAVMSLISAYGPVRTQLRYGVRSQAEAIYAALLRAEEVKAGEYLTSIPASAGDARITLVASDGTVLYDSRADAQEMENHSSRPEILQAQVNGHAEGERLSKTLETMQYYYAIRLQDNSVIRLSMDSDGPWSALVRSLPRLILLLVLLFLLALVIAHAASKKILAPINSIDLTSPKEEEVYDELFPLVERIRRQSDQISDQIRQLKAGKREFEAVTENMNEGLIVLNREETVISINQSAKRLLHCPEDSEGERFCEICGAVPVQELVRSALSGKADEILWEWYGMYIRIFADPVQPGESIEGVILLLLDVTEHQMGEQMRREFSANVSHELKTPLTSISGYAELIENGLAKAEDTAGFAAIIHKEAKRLLALVEDIIALSRLDEGRNLGESEVLDLAEHSRKVIRELTAAAQLRDVHVEFSGTSAYIKGFSALLREMIYNLVENGIKYNREGGTVTVHVAQTAAGARLRVRDTGIGIPEEYQSRVFERFYRVDKSHSRARGGTGLGLSIVKHAAQYHGAQIRLQSIAGEGTCIELHFPKLETE
ncbi:MAG: PAS domain-containing protein [Clostridia bacterium]|nr:PAS domain-containing protein [Clostridia bacterium]